MQDRTLVFLYHIPKTGGTSLREALSNQLGMHRGFIHLGPFGDRIRAEQNLKPLEQYTREELDRVRVLSGHYLSSRFEQYFPDRDIRRIVLLREPAKRILSQYNHAMRNRARLGLKTIDFHAWYEDEALPQFDWQSLYGRKLTLEDKKIAIASVGHNYMSRFLLDALGIQGHQDMPDEQLLSNINQALDSFWHVGSIEQLPASVGKLEQLLGLTLDVGTHNRSGRFFFSKRARHMKMNHELRQYLMDKNRVDYEIYKSRCQQLD
jgi:hypothetical protein